jgi:hypothetical protein
MASSSASPIPGPGAAPACERGNPAWSRVLLVEGTSGVGKSTLIDRLLRRYVAQRPARKLRTLLHLSQAHTYGPLAPGEDSGTLTVDENLRHLDRVVSLLEWQVCALAAETRVKFLAIVDTLHLTQCHRPGVLTWDQVRGFDERLVRLGARLLFLHGTPATLWRRGIEPRAQGEFILGYARPRFGENLSQIHQHFVAEQAAMRGHLSRTRLPSLLLDAEGDDHSNLERAYAFWLGAVESQTTTDLAG